MYQTVEEGKRMYLFVGLLKKIPNTINVLGMFFRKFGIEIHHF